MQGVYGSQFDKLTVTIYAGCPEPVEGRGETSMQTLSPQKRGCLFFNSLLCVQFDDVFVLEDIAALHLLPVEFRGSPNPRELEPA